MSKSPQHERNVSLIINLHTGLVSPQFHVKHDSTFDTVNQLTVESQLQQKAGFSNLDEDTITHLHKNPCPTNTHHIKHKRSITDGITTLDGKNSQASKHSVRFAELHINKRAEITQRRNHEVPQNRVIQAVAASPCKGSPHSKSHNSKGPGVTCTPEELDFSPAHKTSLPYLIEIATTEIANIHIDHNNKKNNKHNNNNVIDEICCYSTLYPDAHA